MSSHKKRRTLNRIKNELDRAQQISMLSKHQSDVASIMVNAFVYRMTEYLIDLYQYYSDHNPEKLTEDFMKNYQSAIKMKEEKRKHEEASTVH